jgi:hypothetical protein
MTSYRLASGQNWAQPKAPAAEDPPEQPHDPLPLVEVDAPHEHAGATPRLS